MKIEDQVCSLKQAKKLEDLGVSDKSHFTWKVNDIQSVVTETKFCYQVITHLPGLNEYYAAFTVAELGIMLPCYNWAVPIYQGELNSNSDVFQEVQVHLSLHYPNCRIVSLGNPEQVWKEITASTLAFAMAEMLIYLLEAGLISLEDVNKRLIEA